MTDKISKETNFIFCPSKQFYSAVMKLPKADEETEHQVQELINSNSIQNVSEVYLENLPGKNLMPIHIGYKFFDKTEREIINIQRIFKGTILVTHKELYN